MLIEDEDLKTEDVLELESFCRVTRRVYQSSTVVALSVEMFSSHSTVVTRKLPDRLRLLLGQETYVVESTLSQQPPQPQREGQVFLLGTLDREATKETPLDGVSVMVNLMLGRRSLVSPKVWQPGCRL